MTAAGQVGSDDRFRHPARSPQFCHSTVSPAPGRTSPEGDIEHLLVWCHLERKHRIISLPIGTLLLTPANLSDLFATWQTMNIA